MSKQKVIEGAGAKVPDIGLRELQSERAVGLLASRVCVESKLPSNPLWALLDRGRGNSNRFIAMWRCIR